MGETILKDWILNVARENAFPLTWIGFIVTWGWLFVLTWHVAVEMK